MTYEQQPGRHRPDCCLRRGGGARAGLAGRTTGPRPALQSGRASPQRQSRVLLSADLAYARLPSRPRPVAATPETCLPRKAGKSASGPRCSSHRESRSLITDHSLPARLKELPLDACGSPGDASEAAALVLANQESWLIVEGGRRAAAVGALHRRGGGRRGCWPPQQECRRRRVGLPQSRAGAAISRRPRDCRCSSLTPVVQ